MKILTEQNKRGNVTVYISQIVNEDNETVIAAYGFGQTKEESIKDLKETLLPYLEEIKSLFV